jgi:hypothetical protein
MGWAEEARAAGWLPPAEVRAKVWRARNMRGNRCSWCGASRINGPDTGQWFRRHDEPQPHATHCRFYSGPVKHEPANGHMGSFGWWISCACGTSYREHDGDGNRQECPDSALTHREPRAPDLTAA